MHTPDIQLDCKFLENCRRSCPYNIGTPFAAALAQPPSRQFQHYNRIFPSNPVKSFFFLKNKNVFFEFPMQGILEKNIYLSLLGRFLYLSFSTVLIYSIIYTIKFICCAAIVSEDIFVNMF